MIISSGQFENGGWMPDSISGNGEDLSPEIDIDEMPEGTVTLAITMDDLDHPIKKGYNHWLAWNIPPVRHIPGSLPKGEKIEHPIHAEQGIGYGKHCYRGPKPPLNQNHRYVITVYALDVQLDLDPDSKKAGLMKAIDSHVLAKGELTGKYQKKHK